jgi:hypothetical protein
MIPNAMAAPKCISGRTSYLRVRLAFHPYPQVLRAVCNRHRCGPPRGLTRASACPWIAHPVSGRFPATARPIQTRFRCGSGYHSLSLATENHSPVRSTKSTPSPHRCGSDWLWASGFRISFIPRFRGAFHHSLTVLSAIGPLAYLALAGGPAGFRRDSACPGVLTHRTAARSLSPTGLSPPAAACSNGLRLKNGFLTARGTRRSPRAAVQPHARNGGTLGTRMVWACTVSLAATPAPFYFLRVREMFQFPGLPPPALCVHAGVTAFDAAGFPHSDILGSQPARGSPRHFAATPRPSSARAA